MATSMIGLGYRRTGIGTISVINRATVESLSGTAGTVQFGDAALPVHQTRLHPVLDYDELHDLPHLAWPERASRRRPAPPGPSG